MQVRNGERRTRGFETDYSPASASADASGHQPVTHVTLLQWYIPNASLTFVHATKLASLNSVSTTKQPYGPFLVSIDVQRLLMSASCSYHSKVQAEAAAVSVYAGSSDSENLAPPLSKLLCSHSVLVTRNLAAARMKRSDTARMVTVMRQWHSTSQVTTFANESWCLDATGMLTGAVSCS